MQAYSQLGRRIAAICLALFFSLASLAPVAAAALQSSSACCPTTKAHACCRKHHTGGAGPAISPVSCDSACGQGVLAQGNGTIAIARPFQAWFPQFQVTIEPRPSDTRAQQFFANDALRQRPPPVA